MGVMRGCRGGQKGANGNFASGGENGLHERAVVL